MKVNIALSLSVFLSTFCYGFPLVTLFMLFIYTSYFLGMLIAEATPIGKQLKEEEK